LYCKGDLLFSLNNVVKCRVVERLNRFVVLAEDEEGRMVLAHNTNTGRLEDIIFKGSQLYCSPRNNPGKTSYYVIGSTVYWGSLINTRIQEKAFLAAVNKQLIPWLLGCEITKYQPKLEDSRFDVELRCNDRPVIVELKSAVLKGEKGEALYPDCPTTRGRKHIARLIELTQKGLKTLIVFIAGFPGAFMFKPNTKGDPQIKDALKEAKVAGVTLKSIGICLDIQGNVGVIRLYNPDIPVVIE
jgi:sugar fermentation stimulation protein A